MLFDQGNVNIGLAHRSYFGWHLGAARHEQVALFQFLQPRAKIKAQQPGQCHRKIGVAVWSKFRINLQSPGQCRGSTKQLLVKPISPTPNRLRNS